MQAEPERSSVFATVQPEKGSVLKCPANSVYQTLEQMRQEGLFCDAVIHCGSQTFKVQRNILSMCSPYFRALFTYQENPGEMSKKNNNKIQEVTIEEMSPEIMEILIKYVYTRDMPSDLSTVVQLLMAADRFQMEGLLKACCKALAQNITLENCMQIRAFASSFPFMCGEIKAATDAFLVQHFYKLSTSADFLQLDVEDLCDLLASDRLNVRTEGVPLDAVCRWVAHDFDGRFGHTDRLLQHVRMGLVTDDMINGLTNYYKLTALSLPVHSVLHKASTFMSLPQVQQDVQFSTPRLPTDLVFVFGGTTMGTPLHRVETFDIRTRTWKEYVCWIVSCAHHGTAVLGHVVYIIGGFNGRGYATCCMAFYPASKKWKTVASMHNKRCYVSVTTLDGYIYAMGGFDGKRRQKSAERYCPSTNQWTLIRPMRYCRSNSGAATVGGKIYIAGGFNGQESQDSAEVYDPATNQWTLLHPMLQGRSGLGVVAHNGFIYAAGGYNVRRRLNTMERYNPDTDEWTSVQPMLSHRSNFGMTVIEDMLMVIGGCGGRRPTGRVELYDIYADRWIISTDFQPRSALSACVVSGLPNIEEYTSRNVQSTDEKIHQCIE